MKLFKIVLMTTAIALTSNQVMAQQAVAGAVSGSQSAAAAQGNSINIGGSKRGASSAIAPGLMASGLSCSGSASVGGAGAGWGFSFGLTKEDRECNARENAKSVLGLTGDRDATKEVLCDIGQIRNAFARVGRHCIADRQAASYYVPSNGNNVKAVSTTGSSRSQAVNPNSKYLQLCLERKRRDPSVGCSVYGG